MNFDTIIDLLEQLKAEVKRLNTEQIELKNENHRLQQQINKSF